MRIISQDGTRDFPYETTPLILRHRQIQGKDIFVIVAIFGEKEYDLAYYHDDKFAYEVLEEVRNTPEYIEEEVKDNNLDFDDEDLNYILNNFIPDEYINDEENNEDEYEEEDDDNLIYFDQDYDEYDDEPSVGTSYFIKKRLLYITLPKDQEFDDGEKS